MAALVSIICMLMMLVCDGGDNYYGSDDDIPDGNGGYFITVRNTQQTSKPSKQPTVYPTTSPTYQPTILPTNITSHSPTKRPTTANPTKYPSHRPTRNPTLIPTLQPSRSPTIQWDNAKNNEIKKLSINVRARRKNADETNLENIDQILTEFNKKHALKQQSDNKKVKQKSRVSSSNLVQSKMRKREFHTKPSNTDNNLPVGAIQQKHAEIDIILILGVMSLAMFIRIGDMRFTVFALVVVVYRISKYFET